MPPAALAIREISAPTPGSEGACGGDGSSEARRAGPLPRPLTICVRTKESAEAATLVVAVPWTRLRSTTAGAGRSGAELGADGGVITGEVSTAGAAVEDVAAELGARVSGGVDAVPAVVIALGAAVTSAVA